jgi:hypothetical protein
MRDLAAMEALVMLGRDCRVAWQSEESAKIRRYPIGMPTIGLRLVLSTSTEEVRDAIYAGKLVSFHDKPIAPEWGVNLLMTRDYRPLFDQDRKVIGIIAMGFSRMPSSASTELDDLRTIICALESPELPNELSGGSRLPAPCLGESSGSLRLAQRLRRFLPQPVH